MSYEIRESSLKKAVIASGLIAILCAVGMIIIPVNRYYSSTVHIVQAQSYMWEIRASTNLTQMAGYFQNALDLLEPFNGQAVWMNIYVPTIDTDFDMIKANLQQAINTCKVFQDIPQANTTYQLVVTNMQKFSDEMADHLASSPSVGNSIQYWNTFDPSTTGWFWILLGCAIAAIIICVIIHSKYS